MTREQILRALTAAIEHAVAIGDEDRVDALLRRKSAYVRGLYHRRVERSRNVRHQRTA